ncbi:putative Type 1 protein exporter [Helianthus annuus]|nr:putative Type 1 protein exporter [Helianthus annuus]
MVDEFVNQFHSSELRATDPTKLNKICQVRHTTERQSSWIRFKYLKAVLRQEVWYFDKSLEASRVVTNILTDILINIQGVISEKQLLHFRLCFLLIIPGVIYGHILAKNEEKLQEAYTVAGGIAQQAFS